VSIWTIFLSAYIIGFSGAVAPGPLLSVTVNDSFRRGIKAGPQLVTGHALLEAVTVIAIAGGLTRLVQNGAIYGGIAFVGGGFIAWMGWQLAKGAVKKTIHLELDAQGDTSRFGPLVVGALTSLANPYFVLWWLTVGAGYVVMSLHFGIPGLLAFYFGHILADYTWYTLVSAAVAGGRRIITQRVYRGIIFCCGLFMLGMAVWFIHSGFIFFQGG
jgi:threonine/homoserine/homoserine lactone efflux protein